MKNETETSFLRKYTGFSPSSNDFDRLNHPPPSPRLRPRQQIRAIYRKVAVVDSRTRVLVFDVNTKEVVFQESGASRYGNTLRAALKMPDIWCPYAMAALTCSLGLGFRQRRLLEAWGVEHIFRQTVSPSCPVLHC